MSLSLERDNALDVLHLEIVACRLVLRCELLHNRTLCESHVVLVSRENLVGVLLSGLLDHSEKRRLHLLTVNDERTAENLVTAVLRVDLCETEDLRVGKWASELLLNLVEILNLLG